MKTPREILFARHRHAGPKLDEVRRNALATLQPRRSEGLSIGAVLGRAWLELIWPSRRAWAAMAVLWLGVLVANLEMKATSRSVPAQRSAPTRELVQAFQAQQRMLAELLPPAQPPSVQAPRLSPRPRSERPLPLKAC